MLCRPTVDDMRRDAEQFRTAQRNAWAAKRVERLPGRWAVRMRALHDSMVMSQGEFDANTWLRVTAGELEAFRLAPDSSDADIREAAKRCAEEAFAHGSAQGAIDARGMRSRLADYCRRWAIEQPGPKVQDGPAIARMTDAGWWRRKLRAIHARGVEGAAIKLGYVHRRADLYASEEAAERRRQQKARNARALEGTQLENEERDRYTLAKLAELSVANPRIRRGELMTRIAGFEACARGAGHAGEFVTVSCPSRMHARLAKSGERNPKYDGTTPRQAQQHLTKAWAQFRAWAKREGVECYGFRIAEPHHDGCPHWHLLMFMEAEHVKDFREKIDLYFRERHDGDEPGAVKNRCKFVAIDWARGSAAGYVAKYVSKNIDGSDVGEDFEGRPAVESAVRVDAWASTWGIRQFQQVGGPQVGVWRELRRLPECEGVPELEAMRKAAGDVRGQVKADWSRYVELMGGPVIPRRDRPAAVAMVAREGMNRYGEPAGLVPYGVVLKTCGEVVKSNRRKWRVVGRGESIGQGEREGMREHASRVLRVLRSESGRKVGSFFDDVVMGWGFQGGGEASDPWSPVNNCTGVTGGAEGRAGFEGATRSGKGEIQVGAGHGPGAGGAVCRAVD